MGKMVNDVWQVSDEKTRVNKGGEFVRGVTSFRDFISKEEGSEFFPEPGRYHLWVADNCPWAHRTQITRKLKRLEDVIGLSVAHYHRNDQGWWFSDAIDDLSPTSEFPLHRLHSMSGAGYSGSATVPVLWDRKGRKIVSDESSEIIRMLNSAFSDVSPDAPDLYPEAWQGEIDEVNAWVYKSINNGVYRCGFARTQEAYATAFVELFEALDRVEERLGHHRYLVGNQITEADVRLFTTLIRFDAVYFSHFKCNRQRISDYPNMSAYLRDLYQERSFGDTVQIETYKLGYYGRSQRLNPSGIIPLGPALDFSRPHDRSAKKYS